MRETPSDGVSRSVPDTSTERSRTRLADSHVSVLADVARRYVPMQSRGSRGADTRAPDV
jgi:hypothetical protein